MGRWRTEIIEHRDSFHETLDSLGSEGGDAGCDDSPTAAKVLAEVVVEHANAIRVREHGYGSW
jgi:hypothetical protein